MDKVWADTIEVVASSMAVLQVYVNKTKDRTLSLETIMLAALIHNIGVLPILTEAEKHSDVFANPTFLDTATEKLSGKIGSVITKEWGFEPEFVEVSANFNDMSVQTDGISYLDLVRLGAALAGKFDEHKDKVFELAIQKGIVGDLSEMLTDDFIELRDGGKQMFAS
jgi:HD-like signal output (HDOD) protein